MQPVAMTNTNLTTRAGLDSALDNVWHREGCHLNPGNPTCLIVGIAADVFEEVAELSVRAVAPHQRPAIGVETHNADAVVAFEVHVLVCLRILIERGPHEKRT